MKMFSDSSTGRIAPISARYLGTPTQLSDAQVRVTSITLTADDTDNDVMRVSLDSSDQHEITIVVEDAVKKSLIISSDEYRSTHISRIVISAGACAELFLVVIIPHVGWSQTELELAHLASHAQVNIVLVGVVDGSSRAALITRQHHTHPAASSSVVIKALLDGSGQLMHHGSIVVEHAARLTVAKQKTTALLCSDHARAWSIPTLEVVPHEVSCAHGAAMGPLDDNQIMYAQSRGIPAATARRVILQGFLADALQTLPESYQIAISKDLIDRVSGAQ